MGANWPGTVERESQAKTTRWNELRFNAGLRHEGLVPLRRLLGGGKPGEAAFLR